LNEKVDLLRHNGLKEAAYRIRWFGFTSEVLDGHRDGCSSKEIIKQQKLRNNDKLGDFFQY